MSESTGCPPDCRIVGPHYHSCGCVGVPPPVNPTEARIRERLLELEREADAIREKPLRDEITRLRARVEELLERAQLAERQLAEKTDPVTLEELRRLRARVGELEAEQQRSRLDWDTQRRALEDRERDNRRLREALDRVQVGQNSRGGGVMTAPKELLYPLTKIRLEFAK